MSVTEIDYDKLQRQLAVLMTNSVSLANKLYDIFVNPTPMDVELRVWTGEDKFESITIPNRAKGNIPALVGEGSPEGVVVADYGTIYIDVLTRTAYIKTEGISKSGWRKLLTAQDLKAHNESEMAHLDVLARINGDENVPFMVQDLADIDEDEDAKGKYAVNKNSVDSLLGGLENLVTTDKSNVVNAINEVVELDKYDLGCVTKCNFVDSLTNKAIALEEQKISETVTLVRFNPGSGAVAITADNKKILITQPISKSIENIVSDNNRFCVYIDYSDLNNLQLVVLPGKYRVSELKPSFLSEGDCWFNVGEQPHSMNLVITNGNRLELVKRNYIYVGMIEVQYDR